MLHTEDESLTTENLNNISYPEEYGAAGDGSTDDQSSIQDCLDNESVVAFKPETTYFVSDFISIQSDQWVWIPESTTVLADLNNQASGSTIIEIGDDTTTVEDSKLLIDGTLDGQDSSTKTNEGGALNVFDAHNIEVHGISVRDAENHCIEVCQSTDIHVWPDVLDGSNDDLISVSDGGFTKYGDQGDTVTENVHFYGPMDLNNRGDSQFEVDDGPKSVYVHNTSFNFIGGGTHTGEKNPILVKFVNCRFDAGGGNAHGMGDVTRKVFVDCYIDVWNTNSGISGYEWRGCTWNTRPVLNTPESKLVDCETTDNDTRLAMAIEADRIRVIGHSAVPDGSAGVEVRNGSDDIVIERSDFGPNRSADVNISDGGTVRVSNMVREPIVTGHANGTVVVDGKAEAALGGSAPDATNWPEGTTVEDTDNAGDLYYIYDNGSSGGVTQIGT